MAGAEPSPGLGLHLTRRRQRLLGQTGQRVNETRRGARGGGAQVEREAQLLGQAAVLDIQLHQRLDVLGHERNGGDDDADAVCARGATS